jgi:flagellar motor switch protein FliN/FliY
MSDSEVIEGNDPTRGADPAAATLDAPSSESEGPKAAPVRFPELHGSAAKSGETALDRIYDLTVPVTVELGRATLSVQEILELSPGAVVELDRAADAPVELFVHGKCVAKGQIVVVDGYYGIRITALKEN